MYGIISHYYNDLPVGTGGEIIKSWTDPHGNKWHRLFLGVNQSGKKLKMAVPENCLKMYKPFVSAHHLPFEQAPWISLTFPVEHPYLKKFRVGTCEGLWCRDETSYCILTIINNQPHNGHFEDVLQWFEQSCKRDKKNFKFLEVQNELLAAHLVAKRGFTCLGDDNYEKVFEK